MNMCYLNFSLRNKILGDTMEKLRLSVDDALEYIRSNVKIHDNFEISYNRVYGEGEVLNMDFSEYFGKPGFKMLLNLDAESINPTIEIDFNEIKDDLIEFHHFPKDGDEVYVSII